MNPPETYYNGTFVFDFERQFDIHSKLRWAEVHSHLPFTVVAIYVASTYALKRYMKTRTSLEMKILLFLWNASLAIGNGMVFYRVFPAFYFHVKTYGMYFALCEPMTIINIEHFWSWTFLSFKFLELGDTYFIVLRKHPLIFLHVYHHITVVLALWFGYIEMAIPGRIIVAINSFIHVLMYSYYAARALQVKVPRRVAMLITSIQIVQLVVYAVVFMSVGWYRYQGKACSITNKIYNVAVFLAITNILLFLNYFMCTYLKPKSKKV